ncbi:Junctophilin-1, partial [Cichlidogyrus casuarinus]
MACQRLANETQHDSGFGASRNAATRRGSFASQRSGDAIEPGESFEEEEPYGGNLKSLSTALKKPGPPPLRLSSKFKCGFVLSSLRSDLLLKRQAKIEQRSFSLQHKQRARSLSNIFNPHAGREQHFRRSGSTSRSMQSSGRLNAGSESIFNLDEVDAIDPETVEVYAGQWDADTRQGYGVCVRSDGVSYEGQWVRNKRHGYGQTKFRDGTIELGRYQNGKLIFLAWNKGAKPHMMLYNYHITREVAAAVKKANQLADQARDKAKQAHNKSVGHLDPFFENRNKSSLHFTSLIVPPVREFLSWTVPSCRDSISDAIKFVLCRLHQVKDITQKAEKAAKVAREYSLETRELVLEMYPDFEQPGIKYLQDMVRLMEVTKHGNKAFENALNSAKDVLSGITTGLASTAPGGARQKEQDYADQEVGLELPPKIFVPNESTQVSRAGSYRKKREKRYELPGRNNKKKTREQSIAEAQASL